MKWIENPHRGREVIYVEGKNEGKVIARPEGLLGAFLRIVRLNPEETRTENGRYTIKDIGIGNLINRLVDLTLLAKANDDLEIHYHGLKLSAFLEIDRNILEFTALWFMWMKF
jgi:hypothetical protein